MWHVSLIRDGSSIANLNKTFSTKNEYVFHCGINVACYNSHRVIFFMCLNVIINLSGSGNRAGSKKFPFVV